MLDAELSDQELARRWAVTSRRRFPASTIDPERLVFIDKPWIRTDVAPLRGWAPCGQRLIGKVPHGRWKTMTFLGALRHDRIQAPWLLEGPIDGESFRLYVEKALLPTLRPGDIVIMDNLGSHKGKAGAPAYPLDEQPTNIRGIWCRCLSRILVGWQFG